MSMDFVEVERAKSLAYFKQVEEIYLSFVSSFTN